ncbi:hypothetical protein SAMN04487949_3193 [Halogranum gelatinilyticum]|uniref:DUF8152 domain-containing protein n=1 Tax=Halogranum gelatinilyticum TaxID=660521 RepID=A0A1G9XZ42_9EURY|nr:hypothetical protein [Halogranum gelatinilyticum]SDN02079.1 hypothetical protein SAMN04487949_3193 [Halogranum gelatinilyticum]
MTEDDVTTQLTALADELAATAERPMRPDVTHWVAEADAVAGDVADGVDVGGDGGLPDEVVRERVGHVRELLSHVEETGDEKADEHVATANRLAEAVLTELD